MIGRAAWFASGVAAGVAGTSYAKRKVSAVTSRLRPSYVAHSATGVVRRGGRRITDAVREGVRAGQRRERELRAERDGRLVRLRDHLTADDEVLVDGETIEPGRVIVMRRHDGD